MVRVIIDFGEKKTTKKEFYGDENKKIFDINDINIDEIIISKILFPEIRNLNEYVIGYKHNHNIKPLYIKLPKYVCSGSTFKEDITISSEINDADFFEKYNKIWKKNEELIGINFEREPQFCTNVTYATKIKTLLYYAEEYQDIRLPKTEIIYKFSSIAILHSVIIMDDEYYARVYIEECKYDRMEEISHIDSDSDSDSDYEE